MLKVMPVQTTGNRPCLYLAQVLNYLWYTETSAAQAKQMNRTGTVAVKMVNIVISKVF